MRQLKNQSTRWFTVCIGILLLLVLAYGLWLPILPHPRPVITRDGEILESNVEELASSEVKLSCQPTSMYQTIGTVVLFTRGYKVPVESFACFRSDGKPYGIDLSVGTCWASVSGVEVWQILRATRPLLVMPN